MAKSVTLGDELVAMARREAAPQRRTIAGQIQHWAQIGRAIEVSGALDYRETRALLETFDEQEPLASG